MALDIKTNALDQRRQTFAHIARRLGEDRPASRYEEATFDLQPGGAHHYRPTWDPAHELYDASRTAIVLADWYVLKDPRQFYYGTYTIARARMMEAAEKALSFVEKRNGFAAIAPEWQDTIRFYLPPLRHVEWGANMNACSITDLGFGAAITQATMFTATDRLGIAQIIGRIGLIGGRAGARRRQGCGWRRPSGSRCAALSKTASSSPTGSRCSSRIPGARRAALSARLRSLRSGGASPWASSLSMMTGIHGRLAR
jgi:phenol hydroxylase P1 protein